MPASSADPAYIPDSLWGAIQSAEGMQDPHPHFDSLRPQAAACSHAAALVGLKDHRFSVISPLTGDRLLWQTFNRWLIMQNAPKHTAIRRLFSRAFTKSAVESYRPLVAATIERLLDGLVPLREMNFLTDFAFQLPTAVISELMALPEQVRVGLDALLVDLDLAFVFRSDEEYLDRGDQAVAELLSRMDAVLAERRANPGDDLISRLVGGEDDGVEHEDLVANAVFLLQAGHDTTMNTLTSGVYTLLQNPEQLEALRADPSLVPTAVEEMLRFNSAIGIAPRLANEDVELPNGTVHAGSVVSFFLGAVNRDAETFDDPHRFDVSRVDNPHLAFSAGAHMCVGAPLARLELQMALAAVLDRLPNLRLVDEPRWTGVVPFRGLDKLNVAWG